MYLDVWRSGTFPLYSCKMALRIQETSPRLSDVKRSVVQRSVFVIGSTLTCGFSRNVPLLHMSGYVVACDSVLPARPSPTLVLQATNAGVRRPGYEATCMVCLHYMYFCWWVEPQTMAKTKVLLYFSIFEDFVEFVKVGY